MICTTWVVPLFLAHLMTPVEPGNVLFLPSLVSASHKIALVNWAEALTARGHSVYWWSPAPHVDKYQPKNATYVDHFQVTVGQQDLMDIFAHENVSGLYEAVWTDTFTLPFVETYFNYMTLPFCEQVIRNHRKSVDKILAVQYDFVIMDELFNTCGYILAHLSKAPIGVYISTCRQTTTSTNFNNLPQPVGYTPIMGSLNVMSDQMSLLERMHNLFCWWFAHLGNFFFFNRISSTMNRLYPEISNIETPLLQPDFQFLCANEQLRMSGPKPRNLIYIGGAQLSPEIAPLSEEWQEFVDNSKKGFILIAMGHWVKWKYAPDEIRHQFLEAVKKIPKEYSIIWQYDDTPTPNLSKNIKQSEWLPQRSLLADPNCKLFITHAGCNGLTEALYHAVPMVAIPLMADQPDGAATLAKRGLGVYLKKQDISTDAIYKAVMAVIKNESYGINIRKMADNIKSDAMTPLEKAVFWTEFAMRHRGGSFYKSSLNPGKFDWIKYYCIDIALCFLFISFVVVKLFVKLFNVMCGFVTNSSASLDVKSKTE